MAEFNFSIIFDQLLAQQNPAELDENYLRRLRSQLDTTEKLRLFTKRFHAVIYNQGLNFRWPGRFSNQLYHYICDVLDYDDKAEAWKQKCRECIAKAEQDCDFDHTNPVIVYVTVNSSVQEIVNNDPFCACYDLDASDDGIDLSRFRCYDGKLMSFVLLLPKFLNTTAFSLPDGWIDMIRGDIMKRLENHFRHEYILRGYKRHTWIIIDHFASLAFYGQTAKLPIEYKKKKVCTELYGFDKLKYQKPRKPKFTYPKQRGGPLRRQQKCRDLRATGTDAQM